MNSFEVLKHCHQSSSISKEPSQYQHHDIILIASLLNSSIKQYKLCYYLAIEISKIPRN